MLILARKDAFHDEAKSRVAIYHNGQLVGTVIVKSASHGMARLGFEFGEDFNILRSELVEVEVKETAA